MRQQLIVGNKRRESMRAGVLIVADQTVVIYCVCRIMRSYSRFTDSQVFFGSVLGTWLERPQCRQWVSFEVTFARARGEREGS